jgi:hypothetical protein
MHMVEDLINFTLTEIEHPLNLIPETLAGNFFELDEFLEEEEFNSGSEDMEDKNDHDEERGKPPQNNQPWLARDALAIPG